MSGGRPALPPRCPPVLPPRTYMSPPTIPKHPSHATPVLSSRPSYTHQHHQPSDLRTTPSPPNFSSHSRHFAASSHIPIPSAPSLPMLVTADINIDACLLHKVSSYSSPDMHLLTFPYKSNNVQISQSSLMISRAVPNVYVSTEPSKKDSDKREPKMPQLAQESPSYPPARPPRSLPPIKTYPVVLHSRKRSWNFHWNLLWVLVAFVFVLGVAVVVVPTSIILTRQL